MTERYPGRPKGKQKTSMQNNVKRNYSFPYEIAAFFKTITYPGVYISKLVMADEAFQDFKKGFKEDSIKSFNQAHPELKKGEIFFANTTKECFNVISDKGKRMGNIAYDIYGHRIPKICATYPIFVKAKTRRSK